MKTIGSIAQIALIILLINRFWIPDRYRLHLSNFQENLACTIVIAGLVIGVWQGSIRNHVYRGVLTFIYVALLIMIWVIKKGS